jgi:hypothetical protein
MTANPIPTLPAAADLLAEEIRDGLWDHVEDLRHGPATASAVIVDELSRRCPGYMREQYRRALARSLQSLR